MNDVNSKPTPEEMRAEAKRKADALIAQADAIDAARAQGGAA